METFDEFIKKFNDKENTRIYNLLFKRFDKTVPSGAFGIIRHEIRNCLIFGMHQAALTLTNHYLERFIKVSLIKTNSTAMMTDYVKFNAEQESLVDKYGDKVLHKGLRSAKDLSIITENEFTVLTHFKDVYRNTFSHCDYREITPDESINMTQFSLAEPGKALSKGKITLKSLSIDMGHLAADFAKANALVYFLAIDDLAMRFELKQTPGLSEIMKNNGVEVDKLFNTIDFDTTATN